MEEPNNRAKATELFEKADLIMLNGDSDEARQLLEEAVRIDPSNSEAHRMLEGLNKRLAAAHPERAIDMNATTQAVAESWIPDIVEGPTEAAPHTVGTGPTAAQLVDEARRALSTRPDIAMPLLQQAIALDPDNVDAHYLIAATQAAQANQVTAPVLTPQTSTLSNLFLPRRTSTFSFVPKPIRFIIGFGLGLVILYMPPRNGVGPPMHVALHLNTAEDLLICLGTGAFTYLTWGIRRGWW